MHWMQVWSGANLRALALGDYPSGDLGGLAITVLIGVIVIVLSTPLGTLLGLARVSGRKLISVPAAFYVHVLRSVPTLVLVFWAYFAPPYFGFDVPKFAAAILALTLAASAYIAENVRGALRAVGVGQRDAAQALGMSRLQMLRLIVLPQAFLSIVPALTGRYIVIFKNTSLAFLIGLLDLTEVGKEINTRMLDAPLQVYLTLLLIYFLLNRSVSALMRRLETPKRLNRLFFSLKLRETPSTASPPSDAEILRTR